MTVRALLELLTTRLAAARVPDPADDAVSLVEYVLGLQSRVELVLRYPETPDEAACARAMALCARREQGEPLQYILGSWSFMGRDYTVGEGVLIPRDDTEVVTNAALGLLRGVASPMALDLCAGSGIIAISIALSRPDATVCAVEKSGDALPYLEENIARHNADVRLIHADLADCAMDFEDGFLDLIVSNPPYIRTSEIPGLQREIAYEPAMALDGGESGCDFYELIPALYADKLKAGGHIAFELGEDQYEHVRSILLSHGFHDFCGHRDIAGTLRAITAKKR